MRDKIATIIQRQQEIAVKVDSVWAINPWELADQILSLISQELLKGVMVEKECQYNDHLLCGANEKGIGDCYHPDIPTCHGTGTISRQAEWGDISDLKDKLKLLEQYAEHLKEVGKIMGISAETNNLDFMFTTKSGGRLVIKNDV